MQGGQWSPRQARGGTVSGRGTPAFWSRGESSLIGVRMLEELVGQILGLQKSRQRSLDFLWVTTELQRDLASENGD